MVTDKIKELKATQAKAAALEKSIAAQLAKELAGLPAEYGFSSVEEFVKAVKAATGGGGKRGAGAAAAGKAKGKRRRRAVITADTKAQVKSLATAGKTGAEIAKTVGISLPSVQNIKKELGLVRARK